MATTETIELLSVARQLKEIAIWLIPPVLFAVAGIYASSRAGSASFLLDTIWRALGGNPHLQNPTLQAEQAKIFDYERFRYITGIKFKNYTDIFRTKAWLDQYDVGLEELIKVRKYFDCEAISIRRPNEKTAKIIGCGGLIAFIIGILIMAALSTPAALLTIKQTGTVLWATDFSVKSWNLEWTIKASDCPDPSIQVDQHDIELICNLLNDPNAPKYLNSAMSSQKTLGVFAAGLAFIFLICTTAHLHKTNRASDIYKRTSKTIEPKPLPTE